MHLSYAGLILVNKPAEVNSLLVAESTTLEIQEGGHLHVLSTVSVFGYLNLMENGVLSVESSTESIGNGCDGDTHLDTSLICPLALSASLPERYNHPASY